MEVGNSCTKVNGGYVKVGGDGAPSKPLWGTGEVRELTHQRKELRNVRDLKKRGT